MRPSVTPTPSHVKGDIGQGLAVLILAVAIVDLLGVALMLICHWNGVGQ